MSLRGGMKASQLQPTHIKSEEGGQSQEHIKSAEGGNYDRETSFHLGPSQTAVSSAPGHSFRPGFHRLSCLGVAQHKADARRTTFLPLWPHPGPRPQGRCGIGRRDGEHPDGSQLPGQEMTPVTFSPMLLTNNGHRPQPNCVRLENRECVRI